MFLLYFADKSALHHKKKDKTSIYRRLTSQQDGGATSSAIAIKVSKFISYIDLLISVFRAFFLINHLPPLDY